MYDEEVTLAILNPAETLLGFLHPKYVDVEETIEWNGLRTIKITHPIFDDNRENLNYYNNLLAMGNKVWWNETPNGDGCLYVLLDDKTVDPATNKVTITAEEAAVELSMIPPWRFAATSRTVDATAINSYMGNLFTAGTIESIVLNYTGVISLMATLREIEKQGNKEVQFRYSYNPTTGIISRYVDIITTKGTVHTDPIEIGYNTENILLEETEADTAIAAAPCGIPSDTTSANLTKFNTVRDEFAALVVSTGTQIPLWVTKDSAGNDVNGPMVYPPYAKSASTNYVACPVADSAADYKQVQQKEKGATSILELFSSIHQQKINIIFIGSVLNISVLKTSQQ